MENELIFRILLGGLLGAFVASRAVQTHRRRPESERVEANLSADSSGALGNFSGATALLSTLVYLVSPQWMTWASISLPTPIRFIGILVALFGFGLMLWAQNSLGANWSDTPVKLNQQSLTTSGPYRWIRHPIYTAFLLILSAPLLLTANLLIGLSWILMIFFDVRSRIDLEEKMLASTFGAEFETYQKYTGRLAPRFRS